MAFARLPAETRTVHIQRVMRDGQERFNHAVTATEYFNVYERMLQRPLVGIF